MPAIDVTDATFEAEVLVRSQTTPVVVDLWAPWCGPCVTLGPIIEKVVAATAGAVALTKVNVDENPQISQSFRVQSIPAVFAISERNIVDRFVGALPEREVAAWVQGLLPAPSEVDQLVLLGDESSLRQALELDPAHAAGIAALATLLVERGTADDLAEALKLIERIPAAPELNQIAARARLRQGGDDAAAWSESEIAAEVRSLLTRVPGDNDARQRIVDLLATMDPASPLQAELRRALTSKLF